MSTVSVTSSCSGFSLSSGSRPAGEPLSGTLNSTRTLAVVPVDGVARGVTASFT
jgi:hypothetical protein